MACVRERQDLSRRKVHAVRILKKKKVDPIKNRLQLSKKVKLAEDIGPFNIGVGVHPFKEWLTDPE